MKQLPFASQHPGQVVELHAVTSPPPVPPPAAPPAVATPPPVPEKPPPVAEPAPELFSEHAPDKHVEPSPHVVHELPFVPHAELSKPERHSPEVSQQPVQVTEEQVRDGPQAEAVTTPSRRPKTNAGTVRSMRVRLPHSTAVCLVTPVIQRRRWGNERSMHDGEGSEPHRPRLGAVGSDRGLSSLPCAATSDCVSPLVCAAGVHRCADPSGLMVDGCLAVTSPTS